MNQARADPPREQVGLAAESPPDRSPSITQKVPKIQVRAPTAKLDLLIDR